MKTHLAEVFSRVTCLGVLIWFGATANGHAGGLVSVWGENTFRQTLVPSSVVDVKAIAAGEFHNLALRADGHVVAWGDNTYGPTNVPSGLSNVVAIAAGLRHSLALRANGTVMAWGNNIYGQTNVPPGLSNVLAIAAGGYHNLALRSDGGVVGWGDTKAFQPFPSNGFSGVKAISAGGYHSLALKTDGTVMAWGYNNDGLTNVPPGLLSVVAIAAGQYHDLALRADGSVVAWGRNNFNQTNVPPDLLNVVGVAVGVNHSLALRADGIVKAWGYDWYGQVRVPSGLSNVTAIAAGGYHSMALAYEGPIRILQEPVSQPYASNVTFSVVATGQEPLTYQWYFNGLQMSPNDPHISGTTTPTLTITSPQFSELGTYAVVVRNTFGSVISSGATVILPPLITQQPAGQTVIAGTNITLTAAAAGTPSLSYQWLLDGVAVNGATSTALTLANVQSSQSGNYSLRVTNFYGVTESSNALVTVIESLPYILKQPTNRSTFLGGLTTFAVNARGSTPLAYQWRINGADIPGATNATLTLTALRYDQAGFYTVAISNVFGAIVSAKAELTIHQVAVWGSTPWYLPTNVPPGLTNLVAISAGEYFMLGLKADGLVALWPSALPRSLIPTNFPSGLSNVTTIAAGDTFCLALKSDGTVAAWGDGFGYFPWFPPVSSPTNVPAGLSNVIAIAAGSSHSLALRSDGRVVSWGTYSSSGLGKGIFTNALGSLSNVIAIAAGGAQALALKSDGKVVAWGVSTNVPNGVSNIIAIACADGYNLALDNVGKVLAWPTVSPFSQPFPRPPVVPVATNVPPGLSNVVAISAGGDALALKADGSVVSWGSSVPPTPAGLSNVFAISAGANFFAALTGDGSPRFTIQPVSQTVSNVASVSFHARAVGIQTLRYQWQRDGADLPGATNADLTVTNARGRDTGNYRAIAANALGAAASLPATLVIPFSTNLAAALNATNLIWTTSPANAPWFAQIRETHDGDVAAQSGRITHSQQSILQAAVVGPGTLTYWWKVSSEEGYDQLRFNLDFTSPIPAISGEKDWQPVALPVPGGVHVLNWVYSKDSTVSAGQDAGCVDEVVFTPASPLTLTTPRLLADGSLVFACSDAGGRLLLPENLAWIQVQTSSNLHDWTTLTGVCTLTNGSLLIRVADGAHLARQFYRLVEH